MLFSRESSEVLQWLMSAMDISTKQLSLIYRGTVNWILLLITLPKNLYGSIYTVRNLRRFKIGK